MPRLPLVASLTFALGAAGLGVTAWRAARAPHVVSAAADALPPEVRQATYGYIELVAHLGGSAGDPRFAERVPASPEVIEEALADIRFATHGGKIEEPRLIRAELQDARPAGLEAYDVDVKEYWVTRTIAAGTGEVLGTRSDVVVARYHVRRLPAGWKVVGWDLVTRPKSA